MDEKYELAMRRNVKKFFLFKTISNFGFMLPVIVLFWQQNGLSMTQIMLLQSIFAFSVVALEIPTGYLADLWGRKQVLIISGLLFSVGYTAYFFSSSFWQFALAEVGFALAISGISGCDSALLYDSLVEIKEEGRFKKIWGQALFFNMLFISFSNIVGGFVGKVDYRLTLLISIPVAFAVALVSLSFTEPIRHKLVVEKGYIQELFRVVILALWKNKKLKWLILYASIIYAFNQAALWFYQPYFSLTGLDVVYFGVVFASFQIVAAFSSKYAHKVEEKLGEKSSFVLLGVLVTGSFLLMSQFIFLFSFTFAFLQQFVRGFFKVVINDYVQKLTTSNVRATVISIQNMFASLLYALIIPFLGYAADVLSLAQSLLFTGIGAGVLASAALIVISKKKII